MVESDFERLLRAAAQTAEETPAMPFAFDTRVLAHWREKRSDDVPNGREFSLFLRRIAVAAMFVGVCAGSAAWWQLQQNDELDSPTNAAYAVADNIIEAGTWQ